MWAASASGGRGLSRSGSSHSVSGHSQWEEDPPSIPSATGAINPSWNCQVENSWPSATFECVCVSVSWYSKCLHLHILETKKWCRMLVTVTTGTRPMIQRTTRTSISGIRPPESTTRPTTTPWSSSRRIRSRTVRMWWAIRCRSHLRLPARSRAVRKATDRRIPPPNCSRFTRPIRTAVTRFTSKRIRIATVAPPSAAGTANPPMLTTVPRTR